MLIGISAEIVKTISIAMTLLDDSGNNRHVTLKAGSLYYIKYERDPDGSSAGDCCDCCKTANLIEVPNALLVSINQLLDKPYNSGTGIVREKVGMYDSVYGCAHHAGRHPLDDFMNEPQASQMKLEFQNINTGRYFYILLDQIRDCIMITDGDNMNNQGSYVLPVATENSLGGIKASDSIVVDPDGTAHSICEITEEDIATDEEVIQVINEVFSNPDEMDMREHLDGINHNTIKINF